MKDNVSRFLLLTQETCKKWSCLVLATNTLNASLCSPPLVCLVHIPRLASSTATNLNLISQRSRHATRALLPGSGSLRAIRRTVRSLLKYLHKNVRIQQMCD